MQIIWSFLFHINQSLFEQITKYSKQNSFENLCVLYASESYSTYLARLVYGFDIIGISLAER